MMLMQSKRLTEGRKKAKWKTASPPISKHKTRASDHTRDHTSTSAMEAGGVRGSRPDFHTTDSAAPFPP
jgi:hypothetical protein